MKPAEARRLAQEHTLEELANAASLLADEIEPTFPILGEDAGEKLTHVLLAMRIRERVEVGHEDPKDAFRSVMAGVREVLTND